MKRQVEQPASALRVFASDAMRVDGVSSLESDLAMLGSLLDQTLARQVSVAFLDTVEKVRRAADDDLEESIEELESLDLATTSQLVRAFSMYFHLANVAEQTHRGRQGRGDRDDDRGPLNRVTDLIKDALESGLLTNAVVEEVIRQLDVRPVFTAHPTEAARRSVLIKLRAVSDLLDERVSVRRVATEDRRWRRAAEMVEELWLTDELRLEKPEV